MKKKIIIIGIIVLLLLLIPIPVKLKDGGTVEYKAVLYKVAKVHRINAESKTGYEEGIIIEILGIQVFNNVGFEVNVEVLDIDGITMEIKEGTLTKTGATIIITDNSGKNNVYGEEYKIEKKENGQWKELDVIVDGNYGWNLIGYSVGKDNKLELDINWEWLYGSLEDGKYRIIKNTSSPGEVKKYYFSAEFELKYIEKLQLLTEKDFTNLGITSEDLTTYKAFIKDKKLYSKNLDTSEEHIIFDIEEVKNISVMPICCGGSGKLLILTTSGNVYISNKDCNYSFGFDFPFEKLEVNDIVSFELIKNNSGFNGILYGKNSKGESIKLYEIE